MDINIETLCPYCRSPISIRDMGAVVVLGCKTCHIEAVVGDDRFIATKDMSRETIDDRLRKRAEKVAEDAKLAKGRYTEVAR